MPERERFDPVGAIVIAGIAGAAGALAPAHAVAIGLLSALALAVLLAGLEPTLRALGLFATALCSFCGAMLGGWLVASMVVVVGVFLPALLVQLLLGRRPTVGPGIHQVFAALTAAGFGVALGRGWRDLHRDLDSAGTPMQIAAAAGWDVGVLICWLSGLVLCGFMTLGLLLF